MESLMKSDVFFFITAVAVVILTIAALFVLYYLYTIARSLSRIAKRAEAESEKGILATLAGSIVSALFKKKTSRKK